eukprot:716059_1
MEDQVVGEWHNIEVSDIYYNNTNGVTFKIITDPNEPAFVQQIIVNQTVNDGCDTTKWALFNIAGYWNKIRYKQSFYGDASCWNILGDLDKKIGLKTGLLGHPHQIKIIENNLLVKGRSWKGETSRCSRKFRDRHFWNVQHNMAYRGSIYAELKRDYDEPDAGIGTSTACSHNANYTISDIQVLYE